MYLFLLAPVLTEKNLNQVGLKPRPLTFLNHYTTGSISS